MDEKTFDQHLKSVLDKLEPAYDPASWIAFQERMDAALVEEQPAAVEAVDKAVYHTLERLEAPYQAVHWQLLAGRMQLQANRILRLRLAKFVECTLLLLLLWNAPNYFEINPTAPSKTPAFPSNVPIAQAGVTNHASGLTTPQTTTLSSLSPGHSAALSAALNQLFTEPGTPYLGAQDYRTAPSILTVLADLTALGEKAKPVIAAADLLPLDVLTAFPVPDRNLFMPIVPTKTARRPGPFYLAASANLDQNSVLVHGARRKSHGHGGAVVIGYRPGEWGLETGIGYVQKSYTPKREVEIYAGNLVDGYYGSTLTNVQADLISIPVKVSRRVAHFGKTTVHASAGLTANFASQKTFDYGTVYYAPDVLPPNFLPDPNQSPQLRQTGRGLLEKGKLDDNFYASLDAGIRIEHPIAGRRYTAFVEPAFRQSLTGKGVGPQREPINTFSIQAGVLAFL